MGSGVLPLALDCSRSLVADDALWLRPPAAGPGGGRNGAGASRAAEGPSDDEVAASVDPRRIWKRVRKHAAQGARACLNMLSVRVRSFHLSSGSAGGKAVSSKCKCCCVFWVH